MSWYCAIPIFIALVFGYFCIYALCKVSADADRHIELMEEGRKKEEEKQ